MRRRFVWLVPLILTPLAVLLGMQYRFLRRLEKTTAAATRNELRSALSEYTTELEMRYVTLTDRALDVTADSLRDPDIVGAQFARAQVPAAKTYFTWLFDDCGPLVFNSAGLQKDVSQDEGMAIKAATMAWSAFPRNRALPWRQRTIDQRDRANRIILKPVTDDEQHVVGVAGLVFDEAASMKAIERMAQESLRKRLQDSWIRVRVGPDSTFAKTAPGERPFFTQQLGFGFTDWRLGIRDDCASPEELAAANFRINAMWTGGVGLLLFVAIGLTLSAAARQMRLSQMKSDFVSNVSHELRTPLSSIRVFGEYMRLGRVQSPEKIREYGEYIETEGRRLTQLINNILDFSRIESAEKKYRFCEGDVGDLVAQTVAAFAMPLRERGFIIDYEEPPSPLAPVRFDRDALCQAIVNLLDNAVKYSGERKEIAVRVEQVRDEVRVSVADRGIGIPAREQKKIFDKFYRVGSGLVHDVKGSGLGLAIVHHVAKAHGGRVDVSSVPGEGSLFTIALPALAATDGSPALTKEFA